MSAARPLPPVRSGRGDLWLLVVAGFAGLLFFGSLDRMWPLADVDLVVDPADLDVRARTHLESRGFDLAGFTSVDWLTVDTSALDYADRSFGRRRTQEWIRGGAPLVRHRVHFKRAGETATYTVDVHAASGILGWSRRIEEDEAGNRIAITAARVLALEALQDGLRLPAQEYEERAASSTELPRRGDHAFVFERLWSEDPELRERVRIGIAGDRVVSAGRSWLVPPQARREARTAEAPSRALEILGFALLAVGAFGAVFVFLTRLRAGAVDLAESAIWPAAVFACLLATAALQDAQLFRFWEPLWPRWISNLRFLVFHAMEQIWIVLLLLSVVAAGIALDRETGGRRRDALLALGRGRLLNAGVVRASWRGFLVGLICGGTMATAVLALHALAGAETTLQPRGFFFYPLNSSMPAATSLLFFFGVALTEELGYRFFAGGWLWSISERRWVAIVLPALIYGATHTRLGFLPPAEPFWARALVLTLVGCVWGWAFFRFDALTVVLSHFTADLFIFNWPRLATGDPRSIATSLLVIGVPLLPAALGALRRLVAGPPTAPAPS